MIGAYMRKGLVSVLVALAVMAASSASSAGSRQTGPEGLVYSRGGDLYAIALDGSRTVRLTSTPVWEEVSPAASPDGRLLAYVRGGAIWIRPLGSSAASRLTRGWDVDPTWAPDGRSIYFVRILSQNDEGPGHSFHEECGSIFRVRTDGREPARLVTNPPLADSFHDHESPSVSPDGARIAFTDANQCSGGTTNFALRVVDRYGNPTSDLTRLVGNHSYVYGAYGAPDWSPDGTRLVFVGGRSVHVANRDGSGRRRLTPLRLSVDFLGVHGPAWSSDGEWIAFATSHGGQDLYVIRPDGSGLRRLTRTKAAETTPAWLPVMPGG